SGHIAGVINPPAKDKYHYHTNDEFPEDPEAWFDGAERHEGSWWGDWDQWVSKYVGTQTDPRVPGAGKLQVIEAAPGSYAKVHLHD
ncbi:MAG TPA: hypothetical protein VK997_09290, partial [Deferrisomatales bacterium]|nr:hypothetical protein [Deferrisomatales bacterium]